MLKFYNNNDYERRNNSTIINPIIIRNYNFYYQGHRRKKINVSMLVWLKKEAR